MFDNSSFKLVIVGHVDHGKSTLIGRLLYDTNSVSPDRIDEMNKTSRDMGRPTEFAYLLDHLEEERQQGITIDTTQVFFKTDKRQYVIIDAPGHVEFIKNMITGASQADGAVLIVDAKEGIMEQTKRHAYILSLLGLKQLIAVINKMDLVDFAHERFNELEKQLKSFLEPLNLNALHYVPLCAIKGGNVARKSEAMRWYKGPALLDCLDGLEGSKATDSDTLLFPVQDIYKIGDKRIIAGRIESGVLYKGSDIKVLPNGKMTKVVTIEKYLEENPDKAYAGESVGILTKDDIFVDRGDMICLPGKEPALVEKFSANIFWMAKKDLTKDERLTIRCATQETACRIETIKERINSSDFEIIEKDASLLKNLEVGKVVVKTKKPISIKAFSDTEELGRFVLERDDDICAGGIITMVS